MTPAKAFSMFAASREGRGGCDWRFDALLFIGVCTAITLLFALTPLDISAARIFYCPDCADHWPLATRPPWSVLYRMAPWVTASLVLGGLARLLIGLARRSNIWRHGAFVLLCVCLGPGLLINGVFKDHWDRPRPRDILELGGPMHYVVAPLRGEGGASFPCGHCAVGFLYGAGWWIWRRRRPRWAAASLAAGLITGIALGIGRMAAGGHFLSDVIWSALLALGLAHALYYYVLRIPGSDGRDDLSATRGGAGGMPIAFAACAAVGGIGVLLALFATAHGAQLSAEIPLSSFPHAPRVLDVRARVADIEITLTDPLVQDMSVTGELHGFGLPGSRLLPRVRFDPDPLPTLHYWIEQRGWFTDLDGLVSIRVPTGSLKQIVVRIGRGNIQVTDATHAGFVRSGRIHLDLHTDSGHVQAPLH